MGSNGVSLWCVVAQWSNLIINMRISHIRAYESAAVVKDMMNAAFVYSIEAFFSRNLRRIFSSLYQILYWVGKASKKSFSNFTSNIIILPCVHTDDR